MTIDARRSAARSGVGAQGQRMAAAKHPAPFPRPILDVSSRRLEEFAPHGGRLLDPFVGTGGIAAIGRPWEFYGVEIEPEWAFQAQNAGLNILVGDSRNLPWETGFFDAVATSPCYGNRLADQYAPNMADPKHRMRRSYRIFLGRPLSEGSAARLNWTRHGNDYRTLHADVWKECTRVLRPGGVFLLNCKNHLADGVLQRVTEWHLGVIFDLGFSLLTADAVLLRGDQNTASMRSRGQLLVDFETVIVLRKEDRDD